MVALSHIVTFQDRDIRAATASVALVSRCLSLFLLFSSVFLVAQELPNTQYFQGPREGTSYELLFSHSQNAAGALDSLLAFDTPGRHRNRQRFSTHEGMHGEYPNRYN